MRRIALLFSILTSSYTSLAQIDPSDGCTGVPALTVNTSCTPNTYTLPGTYSNGGLVTATCAANQNRDDGWYSFVATATDITIEEVSTPTRHLISVWTACAGGAELGCDQSNSGITNTINLTGLTIGTTYYIQVQRRSGNGAASMGGTICVYETPYVPPVAEDCEGGTTVCASTSFTGNSNGAGNVNDLNAGNDGCLNGENESSWYYFSPATSGTFELTIETAVDYDFAIWGPFGSVTCPPSSAPIRCSYSGAGGDTGLQIGAGDNTEGAGGDGWVNAINGTAGDVYLLVIDNYTSDGSAFNLTWNLGSGASLDCSPLPIELASITISENADYNVINWQTLSESNSSHFEIERSLNGIDYDKIGQVGAAGSSTQTINYSFKDEETWFNVAYYRIKMVDQDQSFEYSPVISLTRFSNDINIFPNPSEGDILINFGTTHIGTFNIEYLDVTGRLAEEEINIDEFDKIHESEILKDMKPGLYFVKVSDVFGNELITQKILRK